MVVKVVWDVRIINNQKIKWVPVFEFKIIKEAKGLVSNQLS